MDPLSLLCRLAASVPPPRYHIVKYAGGRSRRQGIYARGAKENRARAASRGRTGAGRRCQRASAEAHRHLSSMGSAAAKNVRGGRSRLPQVAAGRTRPIAMVTDPKSIKPVPQVGRRGGCRSRARPEPGTPLLGQHRAKPKGARRGRVASRQTAGRSRRTSAPRGLRSPSRRNRPFQRAPGREKLRGPTSKTRRTRATKRLRSGGGAELGAEMGL